MNKCNDCLRTFEEPFIDVSYDGQEQTRCPYCKTDDWETLHKCPVCGEWIKSGHDYCNNCYQFVEEALNDLSQKLETTDKHIEQMICNVKGW